MNIWAWVDYVYYDGLLTFSHLCVTCEDERIVAWRVRWLQSEETAA